jgi:hypothetical protein
MEKFALVLVVWLFSSAFSCAAEIRLSCTAACTRDLTPLFPPDCVRAGQECQMLCRNAGEVDVVKGKCVRTH